MTELERTVSQLLSLYWMGRMSAMEAWAFGLRDLPAERDARPKHAGLDDVALPVPVPIGDVLPFDKVGALARRNQRLGVGFVHQDQRQTETLKPVAQERADPPRDAATVGPLGRLDFCQVAIREAEPVVQLLLADPEVHPTTAQQSDEFVFVADDHRFDGHFEPHNHETPHG